MHCALTTVRIYALLDVDEMGLYNVENSYSSGNKLLKRLNCIGEGAVGIGNWFHIGSDEYVFECIGLEDTCKSRIFALTRSINSALKVFVTVSAIIVANNQAISKNALYNILQSNMCTVKRLGGGIYIV